MTTVSDIMTRGVRSMTPSDTVVLAAQAMGELNVGVIPVCDGDKLVGMVTDRDIVLRGVAQDRDNRSTRLQDVMSKDVRTVREHDEVEQVLADMADAQIRRMAVVDERNKLIGIVSLGDIAVKDSGENGLGDSLADISSPAEPDRSNQSHASRPAGGFSSA